MAGIKMRFLKGKVLKAKAGAQGKLLKKYFQSFKTKKKTNPEKFFRTLEK